MSAMQSLESSLDTDSQDVPMLIDAPKDTNVYYVVIKATFTSDEDINLAVETEKKCGRVKAFSEEESLFYPAIINQIKDFDNNIDNSMGNPYVIKQFESTDAKISCMNRYSHDSHLKFMQDYSAIWKNDFKEQGCDEIERVSNFKDYVKNVADQKLIEDYVQHALTDKVHVDELKRVAEEIAANYILAYSPLDDALLKEKRDRKKVRRETILKPARERRWIIENGGNPDNADDCKRIGVYPKKAYPIPFDKDYKFEMKTLSEIINDVDEKINVDPIEVKDDTRKDYQSKQITIYIVNELIQTVGYYGNDVIRNKLYGYIAGLLNNINLMEFALATGEPFYRILDNEVRRNFDADNQKLLETKISYPINLEDTDTERDDLPTPEELEKLLYQIKEYNERTIKKRALEEEKKVAAVPAAAEAGVADMVLE